MSERQKQTVFLKRLLQREATEQQRQLQHSIARAEHDERCVSSAMRLVGVIGLLAFCGLGYEAVLVEDFFVNPSHLLTRLFGYVALGSALCWTAFLGYWLWHRALTNRLYEEGRRLLISRADITPAIVLMPDFSTSHEDTVPLQDTDSASGPHPLSQAA
ncbi:MAG: hypothetical protein JXQ71_16585 [Verrucomicrobia bacterium]|nr:hypothetical protein [Verrucomicrobiota bacterium]